MTYFCGMSFPGYRDTPRIVCDGCGLVHRIPTDRPPPTWFLDGRPPPGWRGVRDDAFRRDYCPRCKEHGPQV